MSSISRHSSCASDDILGLLFLGSGDQTERAQLGQHLGLEKMQARPADARIRASDQRMKLDQAARSYRPRQLETLSRCDDLVRSGGAKLVQVRDLPVLRPGACGSQPLTVR